MPEQKTVWFAQDGKYFNSVEECEHYEFVQELSKLIITTSNKLNTSESILLAEKLCSNYNVLSKAEYGDLKDNPFVEKKTASTVEVIK